MGANQSASQGTSRGTTQGTPVPPPIEYYDKILQAFEATYKNHDPSTLKRILTETFPNFTSGKVVDHIVEQHSELLKALNISSTGTGVITDGMLEEAFRKVGISKQAKEFESAFPALKEKVLQVRGLVQNLHTKYQYFEYKYIEMNLFVMIIVDNILKMFESHSRLVETEIVTLQQAFVTEVKNFADTVMQVNGINTAKADQDYRMLFNELKTKMESHTEAFKQNLTRSDKYRDDLTVMIASLLEKDPVFMEKVSGIVAKAKSKPI
jgi:hypothetical protein